MVCVCERERERERGEREIIERLLSCRVSTLLLQLVMRNKMLAKSHLLVLQSGE